VEERPSSGRSLAVRFRAGRDSSARSRSEVAALPVRPLSSSRKNVAQAHQNPFEEEWAWRISRVRHVNQSKADLESPRVKLSEFWYKETCARAGKIWFAGE
jgi:hypothetical protein